MTAKQLKERWVDAVLIAAVFAGVVTGAAALEHITRVAKVDDEQDTVRIQQNMPLMDGHNLAATLVEVTYGPGAASEAHSHPCPVIGYVIEGTIESQVQGQALGRYEAGQTFYEPPNGVHAVSRNGSKDRPARLLAYFLCDKAGPLSTAPNRR